MAETLFFTEISYFAMTLNSELYLPSRSKVKRRPVARLQLPIRRCCWNGAGGGGVYFAHRIDRSIIQTSLAFYTWISVIELVNLWGTHIMLFYVAFKSIFEVLAITHIFERMSLNRETYRIYIRSKKHKVTLTHLENILFDFSYITITVLGE